MTSRLALIDRDGVLNEEDPDRVTSPGRLVLLPRAAAALKRMNDAGIAVGVVTNQSIVGRGVIDDDVLDAIHDRLRDLLAAEGAHIDALYVATDAPDAATRRRKPGPGMIEEALTDFDAAASETPVIGDALRDMEAAAAAGCPRILVRTGKGRETERAGLPDHVKPVQIVDDLWNAATLVISGRFG